MLIMLSHVHVLPIVLFVFVFTVVKLPAALAAGVVAGQGAFRFELVPDHLELPKGTQLLNAHGWELDRAGNLYLTYEPMHQIGKG